MRFVEGPFGREAERFNFSWRLSRLGSKRKTLVDLPHENVRLPADYFSEKSYQFVSCYEKDFSLNPVEGKTYLLYLEGFMVTAEAWVNGSFAGKGEYGYLGHLVNIGSYLVHGKNKIEIRVDSREQANIPPFGGLLDYMTFGGLFREAHLLEKGSPYFSYAHLSWDERGNLLLDAPTEGEKKGDITLSIGKKMWRRPLSPSGKYDFGVYRPKKLWTTDDPYLEKVRVECGGDSLSFSYGFRRIELRNGALLLNGKPVPIVGLNRHQSYPYVGYAGTKNMQALDADLLKRYGCSCVRTSHYPQSRRFLDECDRIGLLVFEEIPGWQHLGDEAWKGRCLEYLRGMILRDYNHPSIFMWGVRVNESQDDHELYQKTNALVHRMDPYRLRGGVRFLQGSELLEDIYTFNDFSYTPNKPLLTAEDAQKKERPAPELVTEFGGHTYPTRKEDNEERAVNQMLLHLRVIEEGKKQGDIMGTIGWCAFDYNTHHQFGSGNKICHHGVFDLFRLPKFAALAYAANRPQRDYLEIASNWGYGERNYGGVCPLYVFSDCERVSYQPQGEEEKEIPPDPEFSSFPVHVFRLTSMDGVWGEEWKDTLFRGYREGKAVISKRMLAEQVPSSLRLALSNRSIEEGDAVYARAALVDQTGRHLPLARDLLSIKVSGGEILGPSEVPLTGGEYGFYVRAGRQGRMEINVLCRGFITKGRVSVKKFQID